MKYLFILLIPLLPSCSALLAEKRTVMAGENGKQKSYPTERIALIAFMSKQAAGEIPGPFGTVKDITQDSTDVPKTGIMTWGTVRGLEIAGDTEIVKSNNQKDIDIVNSNNAVKKVEIEKAAETTNAAISGGLESIPK